MGNEQALQAATRANGAETAAVFGPQQATQETPAAAGAAGQAAGVGSRRRPLSVAAAKALAARRRRQRGARPAGSGGAAGATAGETEPTKRHAAGGAREEAAGPPEAAPARAKAKAGDAVAVPPKPLPTHMDGTSEPTSKHHSAPSGDAGVAKSPVRPHGGKPPSPLSGGPATRRVGELQERGATHISGSPERLAVLGSPQRAASPVRATKPAKDAAAGSGAAAVLPTAAKSPPRVPLLSVEEAQPHVQAHHYKLHQCIGKGGFGMVFRGSDAGGAPVALKLINKARMRELSMRERVVNEVTVHRDLAHDSVVRFLGSFEDSEYVVMVLEYCSGGDLYRFVKRRGRLDTATVQRLARDLVRGIAFLHSHGIMHRDLKLSNLLLTSETGLKIADFGLAVKLASPDEEHVTVCGTPNYIAPEVAASQPHGCAADMWSVGCLLHTMLVGHPPKRRGGQLRRSLGASSSPTDSLPSADGGGVDLVGLSTAAPLDAVDLVSQLLQDDPSRRPTAEAALAHPFLAVSPDRRGSAESRRQRATEPLQSLPDAARGESCSDSDSLPPRDRSANTAVSGTGFEDSVAGVSLMRVPSRVETPNISVPRRRVFALDCREQPVVREQTPLRNAIANRDEPGAARFVGATGSHTATAPASSTSLSSSTAVLSNTVAAAHISAADVLCVPSVEAVSAEEGIGDDDDDDDDVDVDEEEFDSNADLPRIARGPPAPPQSVASVAPSQLAARTSAASGAAHAVGRRRSFSSSAAGGVQLSLPGSSVAPTSDICMGAGGAPASVAAPDLMGRDLHPPGASAVGDRFLEHNSRRDPTRFSARTSQTSEQSLVRGSLASQRDWARRYSGSGYTSSDSSYSSSGRYGTVGTASTLTGTSNSTPRERYRRSHKRSHRRRGSHRSRSSDKHRSRRGDREYLRESARRRRARRSAARSSAASSSTFSTSTGERRAAQAASSHSQLRTSASVLSSAADRSWLARGDGHVESRRSRDRSGRRGRSHVSRSNDRGRTRSVSRSVDASTDVILWQTNVTKHDTPPRRHRYGEAPQMVEQLTRPHDDGSESEPVPRLPPSPSMYSNSASIDDAAAPNRVRGDAEMERGARAVLAAYTFPAVATSSQLGQHAAEPGAIVRYHGNGDRLQRDGSLPHSTLSPAQNGAPLSMATHSAGISPAITEFSSVTIEPHSAGHPLSSGSPSRVPTSSATNGAQLMPLSTARLRPVSHATPTGSVAIEKGGTVFVRFRACALQLRISGDGRTVWVWHGGDPEDSPSRADGAQQYTLATLPAELHGLYNYARSVVDVVRANSAQPRVIVRYPDCKCVLHDNGAVPDFELRTTQGWRVKYSLSKQQVAFVTPDKTRQAFSLDTGTGLDAVEDGKVLTPVPLALVPLLSVVQERLGRCLKESAIAAPSGAGCDDTVRLDSAERIPSAVMEAARRYLSTSSDEERPAPRRLLPPQPPIVTQKDGLAIISSADESSGTPAPRKSPPTAEQRRTPPPARRNLGAMFDSAAADGSVAAVTPESDVGVAAHIGSAASSMDPSPIEHVSEDATPDMGAVKLIDDDEGDESIEKRAAVVASPQFRSSPAPSTPSYKAELGTEAEQPDPQVTLQRPIHMRASIAGVGWAEQSPGGELQIYFEDGARLTIDTRATCVTFVRADNGTTEKHYGVLTPGKAANASSDGKGEASAAPSTPVMVLPEHVRQRLPVARDFIKLLQAARP